ncbi:MAG: SseB family protein, partial [Methylobacteriaceae bacterium]|nr:SseB family protein [Methylobacteriaceae bacterium]
MFEPENELERLLVRAAADVAARPAFERALVDGQAIVALFGETPDAIVFDEATKTVPAGTTLHLRTIQREGRDFVPFFSAPSRVWAMTRDSHVAAPDAVRAIFARHSGAAFILNPGSAYGKEFMPHEITALLEGRFGEPAAVPRIETATRALIGTPKDYPDEFVAAMKKACATIPGIERAALAWAAFGDRPPCLLLECLSSASREATMASLGPHVEANRPENR